MSPHSPAVLPDAPAGVSGVNGRNLCASIELWCWCTTVGNKRSHCCFSSDSTGGFLLQLQLQLCWTLVDLRERLSSTLGYQLICNFSPFGLLLEGVYSSYYYQLLLSFQL